MPGRNASSRPPRWAAAAAACAVAGLLAAGCQSAPPAAGARPKASRTQSSPRQQSQASPQLAIAPADGGTSLQPGAGITVTALHAKITSVKVSSSGGPVPGSFNAAGTTWHSSWALEVSQRYRVTANAVTPSGQSVTRSSSFRTLTPGQTFQTMIFEGYQQSYGVGMPILLSFSQPVTDRKAVERSLELRTSKPVVGAWHWDGSQALDFRPRSYWPAHTQVSFTGHLNGVEAAPGVYGVHTLTQSFTIGSSLIVVASTTKHRMHLYRNGKLIDRWPISTGRPGDNTPNGTYLTIEKGNPVDMKGPGYNIEVPWSVRFTWSGDYLHDAYWSVGQQGFSNVSHGCVNMPPADAELYYKMAVPGDPVTITGSPRAGVWDNGWTEWFLPWPKYLAGSALHEAVQAGPAGSSFVSPASLPPAATTAPLGEPAPDNWTASA